MPVLASPPAKKTSPVVSVPVPADNRLNTLTPLLFGAPPARAGDRVVVQGTNADVDSRTFVLIEAAKRPDFDVMLQGFGVSYVPLYQGKSADELARHAPYLAEIPQDSKAVQWLIDESWGDGWGVWLRSHKSLDELRTHFRKFTQLFNPQKDAWYVFRFYAPETMRRIVPVLPPRDFAAITQDIAAFIVPDNSATHALVI